MKEAPLTILIHLEVNVFLCLGLLVYQAPLCLSVYVYIIVNCLSSVLGLEMKGKTCFAHYDISFFFMPAGSTQ